MKLIPTKEQELIVETASEGKSIAITAYAGAAKTSTCQMIAAKVRKHSLYVAYNKAIATEATSKFPMWVEPRTIHSLAWHSVVKGSNYGAKLSGFIDKSKMSEAVPELMSFDYPERVELQAEILSLISEFCISDSFSIMDFVTGYATSGKVVELTVEFWESMINKNSDTQITHDTYLKLFQLSKPDLGYKLIYADEFQDCNPVILDIILRQNCQKIVVGDRFQCLVEGTLVDGRPIETFKVGDKVQSFCKGVKLERSITAIHTKPVDENVIKITTECGKVLISTLNHTHIIQELPTKHDTINYLMYKEGFGYRLGSTQQFRQRCSSEGASRVWVINTPENRKEAFVFEQVTSFKYGIPTLVFKPRTCREGFPQDYYDAVFSTLDTEIGAKNLLKDLNLSFNSPHYVPQAVKERALTFTIRVMGDARSLDNPMHSFSIFFSKEQVQTLLENNIVYRYRDAKNGTLRLEGSTSNLGKIYKMFSDIKQVFPKVVLKELIRVVDGKSLVQIPARNTIPGMSIIDKNGNPKKIIKTEILPYKGNVYDFDVAYTHNFIANGVVTHNCIYGWRGAVNAFGKLPDDFTNLELTTSFRFGANIADKANRVLDILGATSQVVGAGKATTVESKAILVRTNLDLFNFLVDYAEQGKRVKVIGDLKDLFTKLYSAKNLQCKGDRAKRYDKQIATYDNWKALCDDVPANPDLGKVVSIVSKYKNIHEAITMVKSCLCCEGEAPDIVLVTAHKSKGLEWDRVELATGFVPEGFNMFDRETQKEVLLENQVGNLLYVALTRAKVELVVPNELAGLLR